MIETQILVGSTCCLIYKRENLKERRVKARTPKKVRRCAGDTKDRIRFLVNVAGFLIWKCWFRFLVFPVQLQADVYNLQSRCSMLGFSWINWPSLTATSTAQSTTAETEAEYYLHLQYARYKEKGKYTRI